MFTIDSIATGRGVHLEAFPTRSFRALPDVTGVAAQGSTPQSATPVTADGIEILLVRIATGSTLAPLDEPNADGATHELVLTGGTDQMIYFANRPNREVGSLPTADMVEIIDSESDNPPNAALVVQTAGGEEEAYVLELLGGEVDAETGDVAWQVALLADFSGLSVALASEPISDVSETLAFDASHLFIDDMCTYPGTQVPRDCDD